MKATIIIAMLAVVGLAACEKTTVNPPATVVQPTATVEKQVAVPVPVPVPGPAGPAGTPGEKGEQGKTGDAAVIVVPEAKPENK